MHGNHCIFRLVKIRAGPQWPPHDPREAEDASLDPAIRTIVARRELDAPEPPHDSLAALVISSTAHETDIAPERAKYLGTAMHRIAVELRRRAAQLKSCRRGLHLMTPENTSHGKHGDQCRACRNAAYRKQRSAA